MKKLLLIITLVGLALTACKDAKKEEKDLLDDLLKVHDKVMGNDETLMKNKMQLDSLLKLPAKDTAEKVNMKAMDIKLAAAEEAMETWMHKFEPDVTGKSHDDIMKYYGSQKKGIMSVDSQMNVAIAESNKYLSNKSK
jgi:acyl-homoserine lactone acylase PvdQ